MEGYMTPMQCVDYLNRTYKVGRSTVYSWMTKGWLPYTKLGSVYLLKKEDVDLFATTRLTQKGAEENA